MKYVLLAALALPQMLLADDYRLPAEIVPVAQSIELRLDQERPHAPSGARGAPCR